MLKREFRRNDLLVKKQVTPTALYTLFVVLLQTGHAYGVKSKVSPAHCWRVP
jgi:hypothetical protein